VRALERILLALLKRQRMHYQGIVNLGIRRNDARKLLDTLVELKLVREEGRKTWKHGKKLHYSLTKKGEHEALQVAMNQLGESAKVLFKQTYDMMQNIVAESRHRNSSEEDAEFRLQEFFNFNCLTFIGDVPCTFGKSVEGLQRQIELENSLRQRHSAALAKYHEEFMAARSLEERNKVDVRLREEVGWTVGEYFKKLLKKTEKNEGILGILKTIYGISEEELRQFELAKYAAKYDRSTDLNRPECAECFEKGDPYCIRQCPRNINRSVS